MSSTTPPDGRSVSSSVIVAAPANEIFDLLCDPSRHGEIDGSGMVQASRDGSLRLALGTRFGMDMKVGPLPYRISNTVVEFEPDRLIAWAHLGGHRWRYELEPVEGGTRVTESFDWSTARSPRFIELMKYPAKNLSAIERTLERLVARFANPSS
jgi:hypothetical protein